MDGGFIICVDDVARCAAARAVVASVVIGAKKVQCGIEQSRFVQSNKHGVGTVTGTETAFTKPDARSPGLFEHIGDSHFGYCSAASFEDSQYVSRLCNLEAR